MQVLKNQCLRVLYRILFVIPLGLIGTHQGIGQITNNQYLPFPQWIIRSSPLPSSTTSTTLLSPTGKASSTNVVYRIYLCLLNMMKTQQSSIPPILTQQSFVKITPFICNHIIIPSFLVVLESRFLTT